MTEMNPLKAEALESAQKALLGRGYEVVVEGGMLRFYGGDRASITELLKVLDSKEGEVTPLGAALNEMGLEAEVEDGLDGRCVIARPCSDARLWTLVQMNNGRSTMGLKKLVCNVSDRVEDFGQAEDGLAGTLVHDYCVSAYITPDRSKDGVKGWRVVSLNDLGPDVTDASLKDLQSIVYVDAEAPAKTAREVALEGHLRRALTFLGGVEGLDGMESGVVQAGEDRSSRLNIDEAKALVGL